MTQDELFQKLKHPNPNLRERAIWKLAETFDKTTIHELMKILNSEDMVYRRAAVKALGAIGVDAVPFLVGSLLNNSCSITVRGSCAKALAQVAINYRGEAFPIEGLEGLRKSLHDPNPVVYISSVMALGEVGNLAFDILVEALNTTDNIALAVTITNTIASIGGDKAKEVLTQLVSDGSVVDIYVKEAADSGLSRLEMIMKNQPK